MANFQSPPKQGNIVTQNQKCSPLWLKWFIDLTNLINSGVAGAVPVGRTLTMVAPMTIGGGASADLSANRTISPGGITVVINTAKLTGAGANGTMTFTNGILTAQVQAT